LANKKNRTLEFVLLTMSAFSVLLVVLLGPLDPWIDVLDILVFAYAAYWALAIRTALGVPLFRNQALGMGLVSISWGLVVALALVLEGSPSFGTNWTPQGLTPFYGSALTFYWVDSSMLASKRIDPLGRNSLHWKGLRRVFWILLLLGVALVTFGGIPGPNNGLGPLNVPYLFEIAFALTGPAIMGVFMLPVVARRTKDQLLQAHFRWFGSFMVFFLLGLFSLTLLPAFFFLPIIVAGYSLYRSARSLVPLNRLSLSES
jgi:hypothetical protein